MFLNDGIESPDLNQKLLAAFCYNFELCVEFKRLYVYPNVPHFQKAPEVENRHRRGTFLILLKSVLWDLSTSDWYVVSESDLTAT